MRIVVSDTGEGIAPELLPHIFEPFRQEKTDHARQGLGLGLSIVKRIVDAHGGTIDVQSPGVRKGSVFVVTLPLKNDADEVTLVRGIASRNSTTSSGTRIQDSLPVNSIQDHAPVGLMAG
jgi:DNA topoisomerase VI subunit B